MRLHVVIAEVTAIYDADTCGAEDAARKEIKEGGGLFSNFRTGGIRGIKGMEDVPIGFEDSYPWGNDTNKTVREILENKNNT